MREILLSIKFANIFFIYWAIVSDLLNTNTESSAQEYFTVAS